MDAKTLEEIIREKSAKELKVRIDALFSLCDFEHSRVSFHPGWVKMDFNGIHISADDALIAIRKAMYDFLRDPTGDMAVKDFLEKVDGLQGQIDELRSSVEEPAHV